jgi:AcrR family transcriptional regulator
MTEATAKAAGARRRRRLSDQESAERMIAAAIDMIRESGLTVSLEHLSVEDVIRRADVSRTAVYRRWKYKDDFFADLLRELARDPHPAVITTQFRPDELRRLATDHVDWVETAEGRERLYAELMRVGGAMDLAMLATSHQWRSYIALQAAVLSIEDGNFRAELQGILADSERQIHQRLAATYQVVADLLGYRIRPDAAVTFDDIAIMCSSVMNGAAIKAQCDASLLTHTVGVAERLDRAGPWSVAAAACYAILALYLEPDPTVTWDAPRIARVKDVMRRAAQTLATADLAEIGTDGLWRLLDG